MRGKYTGLTDVTRGNPQGITFDSSNRTLTNKISSQNGHDRPVLKYKKTKENSKSETMKYILPININWNPSTIDHWECVDNMDIVYYQGSLRMSENSKKMIRVRLLDICG